MVTHGITAQDAQVNYLYTKALIDIPNQENSYLYREFHPELLGSKILKSPKVSKRRHIPSTSNQTP